MHQRLLELDLQIPDIKLAIEVQGPTHYSNLYGNQNDITARDDYKKLWCKQHGVKLLHIEWEGYMKTLYHFPEEERRKRLNTLLGRFLLSNSLFLEVFESQLNELA